MSSKLSTRYHRKRRANRRAEAAKLAYKGVKLRSRDCGDGVVRTYASSKSEEGLRIDESAKNLVKDKENTPPSCSVNSSHSAVAQTPLGKSSKLCTRKSKRGENESELRKYRTKELQTIDAGVRTSQQLKRKSIKVGPTSQTTVGSDDVKMLQYRQ